LDDVFFIPSQGTRLAYADAWSIIALLTCHWYVSPRLKPVDSDPRQRWPTLSLLF